ncbi:MAG TPA: hypothetical protein VFN72_06915 [Solirubrobacterales bacterium]|nr:hypothetical protein [Solirubrobacterales bacterium]
MDESCTWCGVEVERDDGFRAYEPVGERRAVFCRLEHLVPWSIQMMRGCSAGEAEEQPVVSWEAGAMSEPASLDEGATTCSHCGTALDDAHVLLVRHRGEHRVADGFCGVDHMNTWAKAGGRWQ